MSEQITEKTVGVSLTQKRIALEKAQRVYDILKRAVDAIGKELGDEWKPDASVLRDYVIAEGCRRGKGIIEEALSHFKDDDLITAQAVIQDVVNGEREGF